MIKTQKIKLTDVYFYVLVAVSFIFLCVILKLCFNDAVWCDEIFSLNMSKNSYLSIIKFTALDVHPPLYYLILKFVMDTFTTLFSGINPVYFLKFASFIGFALIFYFAVFQLTKELPKIVVGLFLVILFSMQCVGDVSILARMYSFAAFFLLVMAYYSIKVIRYGGKKNWIMFVIFFECAAYTHNFALIAAVGIFLYMLLYYLKFDRSKIKSLYLCGLISLLIYFPWLIVLIFQFIAVNAGFWIEKITFQTVIDFFKYIFMFEALSGLSIKAQNILVILFIIYHLVLALVVVFGKADRENAKSENYARGGVLVGLCSTLFMFAVGTFLSIIMTPILTKRYFGNVFPIAILSVLMLHYYVIKEYILPRFKNILAKKNCNVDRVQNILSNSIIGIIIIVCTVFSALNVIKIYNQEKGYQKVYDEETVLFEKYKDSSYIFDDNNFEQVYYYTHHIKSYVINNDYRWTMWDNVAGEQERPNIDWNGVEELLKNESELIFITAIGEEVFKQDKNISYKYLASFVHEDNLVYNWYIINLEQV